ncbi:MAG: U32 family peptidase [Spirochaetales bacterium]|jgi:putative protease|nr:U32 family peptidase [Spirochaetales bacterium]
MRFFNQQPVELLAPAGNFQILQRVAETPCDAVYFGGKKFNMRIHRRDFNFSQEELKEGVDLLKSRGKGAYITVNNLYTEDELDELGEFLEFLGEIRPDGILIQDLAVLKIIKEREIPLTLQASVMLNVHNLSQVLRLAELGVRRVVLSRELPLAYAAFLKSRTDMELEYFIHGDMCVSHGGQCLYSGMLFGASSNAGRCLKPCRWTFKGIRCGDGFYPNKFPLAVKDMCLYSHIPELIQAGVQTFKIEGRMRDFDYLGGLIRSYGNALDRYLADPAGFDPREGLDFLYENRKRDFSPGYAFGRPGLSNINTRMEGTGAFYSTGKVFSAAQGEPETGFARIQELREFFAPLNRRPAGDIEISVKVNNFAQAVAALKAGVRRIYLSGEVYRPDHPWTLPEIQELCALRNSGETPVKIEVFLGQPRMTFDRDIEEYSLRGLHERAPDLLASGGLDGILTTNLGALHRLTRDLKALGSPPLKLAGDYSFNLLNSAAWDFLKNEGLSFWTLSPEAKPAALAALGEAAEDGELIAFGSPGVMYLEHDLFENTGREADSLCLVDETGADHPVYQDKNGRGHLVFNRDLNYLPLLGELNRAGLRRFRIEAPYLSSGELESALEVFVLAAAKPERAPDIAPALAPPREGWTLGAFNFSAPAAKPEEEP